MDIDTVLIEVIDDTPQLSDIPDTNFALGDTLVLALDQFVSDCDHPSDMLLWDVSGNTDIRIDITPDRFAYCFSPFGWTGSEGVWFRVMDPDKNVASDFSLITVVPGTSVSGDQSDEKIPETFILFQNYPNPFNAGTTIRFILPAEDREPKDEGQNKSLVTLKIYNVLGYEVRTLLNEPKQPGFYTVRWEGTDAQGVPVTSGIYLYSLRVGSFEDVQRMALIR